MSQKPKNPWKEPFDVHKLAPRKDHRGILIELLRFKDENIPGQGQIYTFSINPGKRRGDHYHNKKREWFACVHGEVIALLSIKDGENAAVKLSPKNPKIVYTGPGTAHAFINKTNQEAVMVSYGSTQHDPKDPDTYMETAYKEYKV